MIRQKIIYSTQTRNRHRYKCTHKEIYTLTISHTHEIHTYINVHPFTNTKIYTHTSPWRFDIACCTRTKRLEGEHLCITGSILCDNNYLRAHI